MKRQLKPIILTAGLSALLGSLTLSAQDYSREIANVPFPFHASERTLPAGAYTLKQVKSGGLFQVYDSYGHSFFLNAPVQKSSKAVNPRLTFACYGNDCLLSQVWMPESTTGFSISDSAMKKQLNRKIGMAAEIRSIRFGTR
jgi:hypothetical protein